MGETSAQSSLAIAGKQLRPIARVGEGTYACVVVASLHENGQESEGSTGAVQQRRLCAIKVFKSKAKEVVSLAKREAVALARLRGHPNIVRLDGAYRSSGGRPILLMEYCPRDLSSELRKHPGGMPHNTVKLLAWQLLKAISRIHQLNYLHRDLKPSNMLLNDRGILKLCDFGLAREVPAPPPPREAEGDQGAGDQDAVAQQKLTSYVVTRWYRAPEVLLNKPYGAPADIWAAGCTLAELATGAPLLPGNSTLDQMFQIWRMFGGGGAQQRPARNPVAGPGGAAWGRRTAASAREIPVETTSSLADERQQQQQRQQSQSCRQLRGSKLHARLGDRVDPDLIDMLEASLQTDPRERATAAELLRMPYFADVPKLIAGTALAVLHDKYDSDLSAGGGGDVANVPGVIADAAPSSAPLTTTTTTATATATTTTATVAAGPEVGGIARATVASERTSKPCRRPTGAGRASNASQARPLNGTAQEPPHDRVPTTRCHSITLGAMSRQPGRGIALAGQQQLPLPSAAAAVTAAFARVPVAATLSGEACEDGEGVAGAGASAQRPPVRPRSSGCIPVYVGSDDDEDSASCVSCADSVDDEDEDEDGLDSGFDKPPCGPRVASVLGGGGLQPLPPPASAGLADSMRCGAVALPNRAASVGVSVRPPTLVEREPRVPAVLAAAGASTGGGAFSGSVMSTNTSGQLTRPLSGVMRLNSRMDTGRSLRTVPGVTGTCSTAAPPAASAASAAPVAAANGLTATVTRRQRTHDFVSKILNFVGATDARLQPPLRPLLEATPFDLLPDSQTLARRRASTVPLPPGEVLEPVVVAMSPGGQLPTATVVAAMPTTSDDVMTPVAVAEALPSNRVYGQRLTAMSASSFNRTAAREGAAKGAAVDSASGPWRNASGNWREAGVIYRTVQASVEEDEAPSAAAGVGGEGDVLASSCSAKGPETARSTRPARRGTSGTIHTSAASDVFDSAQVRSGDSIKLQPGVVGQCLQTAGPGLKCTLTVKQLGSSQAGGGSQKGSEAGGGGVVRRAVQKLRNLVACGVH